MLAQGICTTPMCTGGAASIATMDSVYQSLPVDLQSQYQSSHDSLMASFHENYSFWSSWIPFDPVCCTIQELGQQADVLIRQMQTALGQVPLTDGPGTSSQGWPLLSLFGSNTLWIGLAAVGLLFVLAKERI